MDTLVLAAFSPFSAVEAYPAHRHRSVEIFIADACIAAIALLSVRLRSRARELSNNRPAAALAAVATGPHEVIEAQG